MDEGLHKDERQTSEDTGHNGERQDEEKAVSNTNGHHEQERRLEEGQVQIQVLERKQHEEIMRLKTHLQMIEKYGRHCNICTGY